MQKRILLVDDEASLRRTLTLGLKQAGYDTEPCENGITGLKKLESYATNKIKLDGIVLDTHLPDIDGMKLVKIIKYKYPGIPIILITGFAARYSMEEIHHLDVSAFLEKPFTPQELVDQFVKIMEEDIPAAKPKETATDASAYVLLNVDESATFIDTYKHLHLMDPVVYCDATKGDYDIIMLVQGADLKSIREFNKNHIEKVEGVSATEVLAVAVPVLDETTHAVIKDAEKILDYYSTVTSKEKDRKLCSYIFLEVEAEKMNDIYPTLHLDEKVIFCDYTVGKFNLTLMVKTDYFIDIDKFISEKINTLEGIVRVKKYPIVKIFDM
ncbi:MAG: response regulator [bacterium]|nr:response regulator [bacterium]